MHPVGDQLQALGLMAAHETAMADLYEALAGRFAAHKAFFQDLAAQERDHVRSVTRFLEQVKAGAAHVAMDRFSARELLASLDDTTQVVSRAQSGELSLLEALEAAWKLEDSLLEGRRFELIEGDDPHLRLLLEGLRADTATHRRQVRLALEREQEQAGSD